MSDFHYTVRGSWPFPVDMLRHDRATGASQRDQALINLLSELCAPSLKVLKEVVDIDLVIPNAGRQRPNTRRWESFGWSVPTDEVRKLERQQEAADQIRVNRVRSALAKLTDEEIQALEWYGLDSTAINKTSTKP